MIERCVCVAAREIGVRDLPICAKVACDRATIKNRGKVSRLMRVEHSPPGNYDVNALFGDSSRGLERNAKCKLAESHNGREIAREMCSFVLLAQISKRELHTDISHVPKW